MSGFRQKDGNTGIKNVCMYSERGLHMIWSKSVEASANTIVNGECSVLSGQQFNHNHRMTSLLPDIFSYAIETMQSDLASVAKKQ